MPSVLSHTASSLVMPIASETFDAVVLGGGPAGATAALMLAKAGWSVAVVEKSLFPRRKVCGEFLSASSLPLLFELGVGETFLSLAGPEVKRVGYFAGETALEASMPRIPGGGWGRALGREHLDLLLLDAAARAGAKVWQPWRAESLCDRTDGWICTIGDGRERKELSARIVIAATGSWQPGLFKIGNGAHRPSDLLAFKAHFRDSELPSGLMPLLAFPGGYGGMVHSDDGRASLSCCIRRDALERCRRREPTRASDAVMRHIRDSCAGVDRALRRAQTDGVWLAAGPIQPGFRPCYADGVFRVGNLAGEAHPVVAEGISMAMQSSWLLCRHLVAHQGSLREASAEIGAAYAADWRQLFATRIRVAAAVAHLVMHPAARAVGSQLLSAFPGLLTFGAALSGKVREIRPDQMSFVGA